MLYYALGVGEGVEILLYCVIRGEVEQDNKPICTAAPMRPVATLAVASCLLLAEDGGGLGAIWSNCPRLGSVSLHGGTAHLNDRSLLTMSQRCRHLAELSVNSDQLTVKGIVSALMRASRLQRLCIHGNAHLQVAAALFSVK